MSTEFEVTEDDVLVVMRQEGMGLLVNDAMISRMFDDLDFDSIEDAAMCCDDLDEQTNAAHDAIREQVREMPDYQEMKARINQKEMDKQTPAASASKSIPRP